MSHPDPHIDEVLERNALAFGAATTAPPPHIADNPAAYLAWLRDPARPITIQPQQHRTYLDRSQIPRIHRPQLPDTTGHPVRTAPRERPAGYEDAAARLGRLPDLGGASIAAAQERLPGASWEELVVAAAARPVLPLEAEPSDRDQLERAQRQATATTPGCETCGTALDPDGACFTCATADARGAAS